MENHTWKAHVLLFGNCLAISEHAFPLSVVYFIHDMTRCCVTSPDGLWHHMMCGCHAYNMIHLPIKVVRPGNWGWGTPVTTSNNCHHCHGMDRLSSLLAICAGNPPAQIASDADVSWCFYKLYKAFGQKYGLIVIWDASCAYKTSL